MLVQGVAAQYPDRVAFVSENFGESKLAERFGVERYPAVFIEDVLVARPKDFGFFGDTGSQGSGRYTPWLEQASRERFRADMERLVAKALAGELSAEDGVAVTDDAELSSLPAFVLEDLEGNELSSERLRQNVLIVDFWATWCPPCLQAMPALVELQNEHPDDLTVLGVAIESKPKDVRAVAARYDLSFPVALGSPELTRDFGDLVAVPTAFVFDRGGRLVRTFYGAPPELKQELAALVDELLDGTGQ